MPLPPGLNEKLRVWVNHSITNEVNGNMTQGVLPFQYEVSATACGMTALAGLPAYLDLAVVSGLTGAIRRDSRR